jgi:oligopeptide/dipeptide ABC transporter ATP-binding protein
MQKLIEIKNLVKEFPIKKGFWNRQIGAVHAINDISFDIFKGETLGLVGESGCGKSTAGRCILGLLPVTAGAIKYSGEELTKFNPKAFQKMRQKMQIIFQNPYSSLNPRMTIKEILREPFVVHNRKKEADKRVLELLDMVGLPQNTLGRYPHEFSGGQRQRIGIARALTLNPEFIVADEPVSALDISIQAQIINLMQQLKKDLGLTYLFISHDLSVIRYVCDRVAVMYLGEIVEIGTTEEIYSSPKHPYTQALLASVPVPDPDKKSSDKIILGGDLPSPVNPPSGCKFHTRCPHVMDICRTTCPSAVQISDSHTANCHLLKY